MTTTTSATRISITSHIRRLTGAANCHPIEIVAGARAPRLVGSPCYYTTRGGTIIKHHSAYSRRGWSNMVYHCSTLCVEVGAAWIAGATTLADWLRLSPASPLNQDI